MAWTKRTPITTDFVKRTDIYPNFPSDENLVGYWSLDEGSGSKAYDGSGNSNDGTLTNMEEADWVDGIVGKALDFDGSNDYIDFGVAEYSRIDTFSISAWIKPTTLKNNSSILTNFSSGYHGWRFQYTDSGTLTFLCVKNSDGGLQMVYSTDSISAGIWQHVAMKKSGTTVTFYINGELAGSGELAEATLDDATGHLKIAYEANNAAYLDGLIDEIRFYKTALTAKEVSALYKYRGTTEWTTRS